MATNITYLLGAGASAHAIPMVDNMRQRIFETSSFLENFKYDEHFLVANPNPFDKKLWEYRNLTIHIIDELKWLYNESDNHQTIDTLAKKFYITDHENLKRLKRALIVYFTLEQIIEIPQVNSTEWKKQHIDKRYDNLIASIVDKKGDRPILKKNVKVLSWNYDLQFELALKNYFISNIHQLKTIAQIFPNRKSLNGPIYDLINQDAFSVVKINGNALLDNDLNDDAELTTIFDNHNKNSNIQEFLIDFLSEYEKAFPNNQTTHQSLSYFNFAWEIDNDFKDKYEGHLFNLREAKRIAKKTEILIIVGYSFPFFNSEIDREILKEMNPKEIVIQDLYPEIIKSRLLNLMPEFNDYPQQSTNGHSINFRTEIPDKYFFIHPET